MDLTAYYSKIRETEQGIAEADAVVVSMETPDGGKAGIRMEVPKRVAAKMIVEGRARLAAAKEAKEFREQQAEAKRAADEAIAAGRVQLTVLPTAELARLRNAAIKTKD